MNGTFFVCVWFGVAVYTFVAVTHGEKVDVNTFRVEEQQAYPRVRGIDGHYKQYPNDPTLFLGICVPPQMLVDL